MYAPKFLQFFRMAYSFEFFWKICSKETDPPRSVKRIRVEDVGVLICKRFIIVAIFVDEGVVKVSRH